MHLLPRPFNGVDYCVPDRVDPPLICGFEPALVRWRIESTCDGTYTVKILGSNLKSGITGPLTCQPQKEYHGHVSGDESLVCPGLTFGVWGYMIAVCRPDGHCAYTDPGIWVNRGGVAPDYVPTQADYDRAKAEAESIHHGTEADLQSAPEADASEEAGADSEEHQAVAAEPGPAAAERRRGGEPALATPSKPASSRAARRVDSHQKMSFTPSWARRA